MAFPRYHYARSSASDTGPNAARRQQQLRELCARYGWSVVPSDRVVAQVLQDAADAYQMHALSNAATVVLICVRQPFAGREAAVGNCPASVEQLERIASLQCAVKDLQRPMDKAHDQDKPHRGHLLLTQAAILEGHERAR